ncbi:hypothetical protein A2434_01035 [Candidatus Woesebacteria bacterium RIFOXYC1_FULL_41_14]|uniref:Uncharacterized protein n=3 Tax=Candidatus Woeseibacteriota TaxID=1752722 RepID=A0A0G0T5C1_9BACT|nr:MAG: hypothetical protein UT76_C0023G0015 [Candidatus Woesebacteria bacterium GW2011_GWB1_40_12]KKS05424.1 MAG: hypothetical protein UU57_C0007G0014 [Candidatus Woesebacteria bacterium GW2011_GWE1_41_24]OGM83936.1 MAG: hypothetical protein A2434_01035 [Candidatus Woesebacteria bacterium RIFOXYC1_FULL_41_14]OGM88393.1 MAG: hypothetical protein A2594_02110 [Candidatus Woesebacteria bacterium RIFOXYD1_FULL_41_28]
MLVNFLFGFLGVILFLFVFWKRLKDDYSSDIIFQVATSILVGLAVGYTASKIFFPEWNFWMSFLGYLFGMIVMVAKFKLRTYGTIEAAIMAGIPFISLMFFKDSITNYSLNSFLAFVGTLVLIFLIFWVDLNYKSFTWYKSGKIGFAGLFTSILFFAARTVIAIIGITMVSFVGKFEAIISGMTALACIGLLVNLSRRRE